jgi:hypothetical protein
MISMAPLILLISLNKFTKICSGMKSFVTNQHYAWHGCILVCRLCTGGGGGTRPDAANPMCYSTSLQVLLSAQVFMIETH